TEPSCRAATCVVPVDTFELTPADFGFDVASESDIAGGDAKVNAEALRAVLAGEPSAYRNMVLMNAACSLVIADKAESVLDGVALATNAIDNGAANSALETLIRVSNQGKE
ncbi:MAG: anthranilate phosphoribosyltransferase, partial [Pseudomonadota bacterium]